MIEDNYDREIMRAIADPGQYTPRGFHGDDHVSDYSEPLPAWQMRAVMAVLASRASVPARCECGGVR